MPLGTLTAYALKIPGLPADHTYVLTNHNHP